MSLFFFFFAKIALLTYINIGVYKDSTLLVVARNDIVFLTEYLTVGTVVVDFSIE